MAEFGLVDITIFKDKSASDTAQVPASSISVAVYREGAWTNGSGSIADTATGNITVHSPGRIAAADTVKVFTSNALSTASGTVNSVTATTINITVAGGAFSWSDAERIVPTLAAEALYSDDLGVETKTNPLTTDSRGRAWGYTSKFDVDIVVSGSGITTTLFPDWPTRQADAAVSDAVDSATAVAYTINTSRAWTTAGAKILSLKVNGTEKAFVDIDGDLDTDSGSFHSGVADGATAIAFDLDSNVSMATAGSKLLSLKNATVEKFSVNKDGGFTAAQVGTISAGGLTVSAGGVTVTGNSTITGTLGSLTGLTIASGNLTLSTSTSSIVFSALSLVQDSTNNDLLTVSGGSFRPAGFLGLNKSTPTIATGQVSGLNSYLVIDTEAAAATDDLDTVTSPGTNMDGAILVIRAVNSARTVVCKDGTGNLLLAGDMTLDNEEDSITLIWDATLAKWFEIARSNNGA